MRRKHEPRLFRLFYQQNRPGTPEIPSHRDDNRDDLACNKGWIVLVVWIVVPKRVRLIIACSAENEGRIPRWRQGSQRQ